MNQLFGLQHRGDRHLGHSSHHTQVPVPVTRMGTGTWVIAVIIPKYLSQ